MAGNYYQQKLDVLKRRREKERKREKGIASKRVGLMGVDWMDTIGQKSGEIVSEGR